MAAATVRPVESGSWTGLGGVDSTGHMNYPVDDFKGWAVPAARTSFESRRQQPVPTEVILSFQSVPVPIPENAGTPELADLEQGRIIG